MKRMISVLLAFAFALGINASAFAVGIGCLPTQANNAAVQFGCISVTSTVTGSTFTDSVMFVITPAQSKSGVGSIHQPGVVGQALGFSGGANGPNGPTFTGQLLASLNPDPIISYDLVYEASVATSVHFTLGTLIDPTYSPASLTNSVDGIILTDGGALDGQVIFTPFVNTTNVSIGSLSTDSGQTLIPGGVDIISGFNTNNDITFTSGNSFFYGGTSVASFPDPQGGYFNYMQLDLQFDLTQDDTVHFVNGNLEITGAANGGPTPMPEPATLLLLGSGLAGYGIVGRWKKYRGRRI